MRRTVSIGKVKIGGGHPLGDGFFLLFEPFILCIQRITVYIGDASTTGKGCRGQYSHAFIAFRMEVIQVTNQCKQDNIEDNGQVFHIV